MLLPKVDFVGNGSVAFGGVPCGDSGGRGKGGHPCGDGAEGDGVEIGEFGTDGSAQDWLRRAVGVYDKVGVRRFGGGEGGFEFKIGEHMRRIKRTEHCLFAVYGLYECEGERCSGLIVMQMVLIPVISQHKHKACGCGVGSEWDEPADSLGEVC